MNYWLLKSEPDCYSIDDLRNEKGPSVWEGCRNYTVRNFFRDAMADGDLGFFYHSNADPSGIVGVLRIVGDAVPDPTQFDPDSEYFDPKAVPESPRWITRNVVFEEKFRRVLSLADLRQLPGLEDMMVLRKGQRLSVMPVTAAEWERVLSLPDLR